MAKIGLVTDYVGFSGKPKNEALTGSFKLKKFAQRIKKRPTGFIFKSVGRFSSRWQHKLLEFFSNFCGLMA
jgi:hypothetical protein